MTVTYYTAEFTDKEGDRFHASIFWDKYHQRSLSVHLGRYLSLSEVDYPIWKEKGSNSRAGLDALKTKLAAKTNRLGLSLVSEMETRFAPKAE
jgi:hypothetical protein